MLAKRVRLEGVYLKRKYSHCPILMEWKRFYFSHRLFTVAYLLFGSNFGIWFKKKKWLKFAFQAANNRDASSFGGLKMTMGGLYWWISFKGDRLTSEHKLGVALNAFYINCTTFGKKRERERRQDASGLYLDVRSILLFDMIFTKHGD